MGQSVGSKLLLSGMISMMVSTGRIFAFTCSRTTIRTASSIRRPERLCYFPKSKSTPACINRNVPWMSSTASNTRSERKSAPNQKTSAGKKDGDSGHQPPIMNLYTISKEDLQEVITMWGYPKYRADQVYHWIREKGVVDADQMLNVPKKLRQDLKNFSSGGAATNDQANANNSAESGNNLRVDSETTETMNTKASTGGALELVQEQVSPKDGTIKRLYRLRDGYLIESVLMPYEDGRWTSCISSQVSVY